MGRFFVGFFFSLSSLLFVFFSLLASPLHQGNGVEVWFVGVLALECLPGEEEKERRLAVGLFLLAGKRREREEEGLVFFEGEKKREGERKVWLCFYGGPLEGRRDGDGGLNCGGESLIFEKKRGRKKREKMLCWS